jgi:hypothetical protein
MKPASNNTLSPEQGMFELTLMNADSASSKFDDVVIEALNRGVPAELVTRLKDIWTKTQVIAGEVVAIGKIIVLQILEFLKRNPKLTVGLAMGAALATLVSGIPILGPLIQAEATFFFSLYGAGAGAAMANGDQSGSPFTAAIALAENFFRLLKDILNAVSDYISYK